MIEKKIHYIWLGGEKSLKVQEIIKTWKIKLPDYEIIEWNEGNINLENLMEKNRFFRECYNRKLWAFASDYLRSKIMYENGGIYLDTDMEILKSLDDFLENDFFIGKENEETISCGIIGAVKNHAFFKKMLDFYEKEVWNSKLYIITSIATNIIAKYSSQSKNIKVYEPEYFYPYSQEENLTEEHITKNTYAIHHWGKSWGKNSEVYFLKYKHLKSPIRQIKIFCKIIRNKIINNRRS